MRHRRADAVAGSRGSRAGRFAKGNPEFIEPTLRRLRKARSCRQKRKEFSPHLLGNGARIQRAAELFSQLSIGKSQLGVLSMSQGTVEKALPRKRPPVTDEVVLEARALTKVYRDFWGREKVRALKGLDLQVKRGEIFGLLGPNGSGKSTTIKLLLGLLFPSSGEALVFGRPADEVAKNELIGYLPEESYLYKFLDAEETLDFYGRLFNMSAEVRAERVAQLIDMVKLNWAKGRQLREYSKGMTRRIGLAQALINDPQLILLDEPTSGLDPIATREMKDLILRLRDEGKTILLSSHLLYDVQDVCDRIAILHQGELKELGRVDALLQVRDVTQFRVRNLPPQAQEEIRNVIAKFSGELVSMETPTTTLEELFLKIVRESEEHPGRRPATEDEMR